ncbi:MULTISPECIES: DsbE family thiol:disulfide interchange protein [Rhodobacterales]|jgi:cytochrome c biogenesis protein CcmG/thiol:disulfide interchange protein DsbE|uniref:Cytochrome c biogenesis protein CcmG, thiol:disulfide interchange protein DsbE n=2 Tax=Paracoccaceae TaxID=31989 RepID=A0A1I7DI95_9RHOB|nr:MULTISPECIES: DsbE family thiol:disulfide interchange protein [Rhodobacterales]MDD9745767.1 DsbE family thiol:disulfide interchange protein [Marinovum sp. PR37]MDE4100202.1 DsbE family thiol:disulfide interchange protein [Phaeobacter gallaeciensis]MDE4109003.1 DsbE family thiol:disulfide interchange protein [Phaeobacter gallaeciensis]MDE4113448.1 DsbE family thiol:disulfide interchange protein [Phaeobacter gallaeciensis]MDE4117906.1 DsbE family thiol:disulfide interchange protein [Phaeobact
MSAVEANRRKGRLVTVLPVAIFALIGAGFYWGLFNGNDTLPSPLVGKAVPEFDLPPIEGRTDGLSTADLKGQVSIVNVWASWCVPCRVEMPLLNELAAQGEVPIFGINYKDRPEEALGFLDELGDPYTRIGADRNGRVSIDWGVYGLPETFVIDAEGRIAYKHIGPFNRNSLEENILPVVRRLQEGAGS